MLLFSDGFKHMAVSELWRKWGHFSHGLRGSRIVFGVDQTSGKSWGRKDGYGLQFLGKRNYRYDLEPSLSYYYLSLGTPIRKSRTVYTGFAIASHDHGQFAFDMHFYSRNWGGKYPPHKIAFNEGYTGGPLSLSNEVACCRAIVRGNVVDYTWTFPSSDVPTQYNQVDAHTNLCSGDFFYHQVGITLHGNTDDGSTAWVENRVGQRGKSSRLENVYTASPNTSNSWFIDAVEFRLSDVNAVIDDFYIANEEGSVNNDFLGSVVVRQVGISGEGAQNNSESFGDSYYRSENVSASDIVDTQNNMPAVPPTPDENPLFLSYSDPRDSYIRLSHLNDTQLFRTHAVNYAGSQPFFFGAITHQMVRAPWPADGFTTLEPKMLSSGIDVEGHDLGRPVYGWQDGRWEMRSMVFENTEGLRDGIQSAIWDGTALNNTEFGFKLVKVPLDADSDIYNPEVLRLNYTFENTIDETFWIDAEPQRFWEEKMEEYYFAGCASSYQKVFALYESFCTVDTSVAAKVGQKYLNSVVHIWPETPLVDLWNQDVLAFQESVVLSTVHEVIEELSLCDPAYGFWVEELNDGVEPTDDEIWGQGLTAADNFGVEDFPRTNHVLIDERLWADCSYIFSGHELVDEYLYPRTPTPIWGWKMDIEDYFDSVACHFDGNWVERDYHQYSMTDSVLTAQWRHEYFWGVCIASWQIEPIEMECPEGSRVGELTSQYWSLMGYAADPTEI
jgi:hypothetical protein